MNSGNVPNDVKIMMVKGAKGDDGFSPTLSEAPITGGHRVTMTDAEGTETFDVMDGVSPSLSEEAINNGYRVTMTDASGTSTFDLHNATSGDYQGLTNKPSINGVEIYGAKTGADYGLIDSASTSINGVNVSGAKTGDDYGLVSISAVTSLYLSTTQTIPASSHMTLALDFPAGYDLQNDYVVLGVPHLWAGMSLNVLGWSCSNGWYPDDPGQWVLELGIENLIGDPVTSQIEARVAVLKL